MKAKYFLVTVLIGIMVMAFGNAAVMADKTITTTGEEETTFDYSKMDKNFQYREGWGDYYDIGECSNIKAKNVIYAGNNTKLNIKVEVHDTKSNFINKVLDQKYYKVICDIKPGKATATIQGINGFYGSKKVTFKIKMPTIKIKSVKVKEKKIKIKVKKNSVVKYQIRYKKNTGKMIIKKGKENCLTTGKWKTLLSNKNTIKTKKLKKGNYFLQVRSYIDINGKKYYGKWKAYNALINVGTKKANKKNLKYCKFISPNKFMKYYKKNGYKTYYNHLNSFSINGVKTCGWTVLNYYNNKEIYSVEADKYGNTIIKY